MSTCPSWGQLEEMGGTGPSKQNRQDPISGSGAEGRWTRKGSNCPGATFMVATVQCPEKNADNVSESWGAPSW